MLLGEGPGRAGLGVEVRRARIGTLVVVAHRTDQALRDQYHSFYDDKGAVARRYRRMDEVGTPWCLTIDGETIEKDTLTVRERDSMLQERVPVAGIAQYLKDRLKG